MIDRRAFLTGTAALAGGLALEWNSSRAAAAARQPLLIRQARLIRVRDSKTRGTDTYLELSSATGLKGFAGPLLGDQAKALPANLQELLAGRDAADPAALNFSTLWEACHPGKPLSSYAGGKDPLTGEAVWGIRRSTRHTPTGWLITALSAVDLALWDLRGKAAGKPVHALLGARRDRLDAYASLLGFSVKPAEARKIAREYFDKGFKSQKWFFENDPAKGAEGLKQNIELVRQIREELGAAATLMFDGIQYVWKSDSVDFAIALAKGIAPYQPHWLEEPLRPDDFEGYARLKGETGITLAAGEHWYTRWNVKPFLERGIVSVVQSDPEWCGGLSEWLKICELAAQYKGVQVIPHGHHVLAASAGVASQSAALCPMMEYLIKSRLSFQHCQTRPLLAESGAVALPPEPGLGPSLDESRLERV